MTLSIVSLRRRRAAAGADVQSLWKAGWYQIGAQRIYFRSKWEANYACYLEWLRSRGEIASWLYEPTTFWFIEPKTVGKRRLKGIKRGTNSYKPDFLVTERSGTARYEEIKGWFDPQSKTKLKRMALYYPEVRVILISKSAYQAIARQVRGIVPGWQ